MIDVKGLIEQQRQLAKQVCLKDDYCLNQPEYIAGMDVGFEGKGAITKAAAVVLAYPGFELIEYQVARINTELPYIPGLLSFRELPALLKAWEQLKTKPRLVFVDGQGIAHPRRLGIASHLGLCLNLPTIGVAKSKLCGQHELVGGETGSAQPLTDNSEHIGFVLRSKVRCNPLYISPGHLISPDSSLHWVLRCLNGYRLPEPTRWADAVASERPLFNKWLTQNSSLG